MLGQVKVDEKSNEIIAIPKLLAMLSIEGAIVTIDAMGCQKEIAKQILDKKAEYVLALKGNQGTLRGDVELFAAEQKANGFKHASVSRHETVDSDHGRIETRKYTVLHDVSWLKERHGWPGLEGIIMVESTRETGTKSESETRFYITSLKHAADRIASAVRGHWAIENSLHWVMDMVFRDDDCRVREGNAAANFVTLRHISLSASKWTRAALVGFAVQRCAAAPRLGRLKNSAMSSDTGMLPRAETFYGGDARVSKPPRLFQKSWPSTQRRLAQP